MTIYKFQRLNHSFMPLDGYLQVNYKTGQYNTVICLPSCRGFIPDKKSAYKKNILGSNNHNTNMLLPSKWMAEMSM